MIEILKELELSLTELILQNWMNETVQVNRD